MNSKPDGEHTDYLIYNYLIWMSDADPTFSAAREELERLSEAHPEFRPREHPDMDHWMSGGFVGPRRPWPPDELGRREPGDALADLLEYRDKPFDGFEPGWTDIRGLVAETVQLHPDWGLGLAEVVIAQQDWESDLWGALIQGWAVGSLDEARWNQVLDVLLAHQSLQTHREAVTQLLEQGTRKLEEGIPLETLPKADALATRLWERSEDDNRGEVADWLSAAINNWSGKLAEFWLHRIQRIWHSSVDSWSGLDAETSRMLESMITGSGQKSGFARTVFAGQFDFLSAADFSWTIEKLLPVFDWDRSLTEAAQAWDGFLTWGRWNQATLPRLIPFYIQSVSHLADEPKEKLRRLFDHLANVALYGSIDQLGPSGWLDSAIAAASPNGRVYWAQAMGLALRNAPPEAASNAFAWILRYWRRRLDGVPLLITGDEGREMADWLLYSDDSFPAGVQLLETTPMATSNSHRLFVRQLKATDLPKRFPNEAAVATLSMLRSFSGPFFDAEGLEALVRMFAAEPPDRQDGTVLSQICAEAVRLGITTAASWLS